MDQQSLAALTDVARSLRDPHAASAYAMKVVAVGASTITLEETPGNNLTGVPVIGGMPTVGATVLYVVFAQRGWAVTGGGGGVATPASKIWGAGQVVGAPSTVPAAPTGSATNDVVVWTTTTPVLQMQMGLVISGPSVFRLGTLPPTVAADNVFLTGAATGRSTWGPPPTVAGGSGITSAAITGGFLVTAKLDTAPGNALVFASGGGMRVPSATGGTAIACELYPNADGAPMINDVNMTIGNTLAYNYGGWTTAAGTNGPGLAVVAPLPGIYQVTGQVSLVGATDGSRYISILVNGTRQVLARNALVATQGLPIAALVDLVAGDRLEMQVGCSSVAGAGPVVKGTRTITSMMVARVAPL